VARFLWGSATTLLVAVLVLLFISLPEVGDPPMTLLHPGFPLVEDGVAALMVCGEQPTRETVNRTAAAVVRDRWTGEMWTYNRQDGCVVYYQHPRDNGGGD